jgi:hypothetical protein
VIQDFLVRPTFDAILIIVIDHLDNVFIFVRSLFSVVKRDTRRRRSFAGLRSGFSVGSNRFICADREIDNINWAFFYHVLQVGFPVTILLAEPFRLACIFSELSSYFYPYSFVFI